MARAQTVEKTPSRVVSEVQAVVCGAFGAALALSFVSYDPAAAGHNYVGPVGHAIADFLIQAFGYGAYLFPFLLITAAVALFVRLAARVSPLRIVGGVALLLIVSVACGLYRSGVPVRLAGGWVGGFVATLMRDGFGLAGSSVVLAAMTLLVFIMITGLSLAEAATGTLAWTGRLVEGGLEVLGRLWKRLLAVLREHAPRLNLPSLPNLTGLRKGRVSGDGPQVVFAAASTPTETLADPVDPAPAVDPVVVRKTEPPPSALPSPQEEFVFGVDSSDYQLPPPNLLGANDDKGDYGDEQTLVNQSKILEQKLATFGITGRVVAVRPGPVITTFEFEPEAGIKVSRVVNLSDDLTMALRAHSVRIVAPIPGKNVVGIEVSNRNRAIVGLRDLIESEEFRTRRSPLTLAMGRDTTGAAAYADLCGMPHLLMAGATGTGKSVSLNALILSILYKATARDVRFIMIDPKMLELSLYDGIPHLLVPVVTDVRKAAAALGNVMRVMDHRFDMLKDKQVRNIDDYNRRLVEEDKEGAGKKAGGQAGPGGEATEGSAIVHEHLPRIVVVVDELADLMMVVGREIETSITRLAQKARAAGIHLILATQRPSVDVITGLIKANFPCRVSFKVTTRPDSRTILDSVGSERLLGNGDMLYMASGSSFLQRLHGAFISDREIRAIVGFLKKQGDPDYHMELLEMPSGPGGGEEAEEFFDELYDRAVDIVLDNGQGSTSWLQRKLGIGYNRAARIMEHMEREGVVGPADGAKPRKVMVERSAMG